MTTQQNGGLAPTRRTLVKGAAWSVPVVAMASPAHAVGCSVDPTQDICNCLATSVGFAYKWPGVSTDARFDKTNVVRVCFTANDCGPTGTTATIVLQSVVATGSGCPRDYIIKDRTFTIADGQTFCTFVWFRADSSAERDFTFTYSLNGQAGYRTSVLNVKFSPINSTTCPTTVGTNVVECAPYETRSQPCPGPVPVPNLVGLTQVQAQAALDEAGLKLGVVTTTCNTAEPNGVVLDQDPDAGTTIVGGSPVNIVLNDCPAAGATSDQAAEDSAKASQPTQAKTTVVQPAPEQTDPAQTQDAAATTGGPTG